MTFTYPGVYIQELPSPVHSIAAAATSIAAFVGYTARGIDNRAQVVNSYSDYQRLYGGVAFNSELSYAVQQFFQNGGAQAYVVRVPMHGATLASVAFDGLTFTALSSGSWANGQLLVDTDIEALPPGADPMAFNLTITDLADNTTESFPNVTLNSTGANYVLTVVNDPDMGSQLVNVAIPGAAPAGPVNTTGLTGTAITTADVNKALGGGGTTTTAAYGLVLTTTNPAPSAGSPLPLTITVFPNNTPVPQSMAGLAAQLQQALNAALTGAYPNQNASAVCSVTPIPGASPGQGIRVNANLPQMPDAEIQFSAPAPSAGADASAPLGLNVAANVAHYALGTGDVWGSQSASTAGGDGGGLLPQTGDLIGSQAQFTGLYALQKVPVFNLLSIPDATRANPIGSASLDPNVNTSAVYSAAIALCDEQRAFLLIDPSPAVTSVSGAVDWITEALGVADPNGNGAAFWPRLRLPDPANNYKLRTFAPSGVVAGLYARSDAASGVWTAPAGIQATLSGVQSMTYQMSDQENGQLNPLGLNCFRTFPVYGPVLWGSRTIAGADAMANQWKYVPVRRMALFLELSLYSGLQWAVFQPNDERLWAAIRLNVNSFMQTYFLKGAFQGMTPDQAYFVKCDSETTTPTDQSNGVVNILVGFAPLQPAEFVLIQIEQLTGQAQS